MTLTYVSYCPGSGAPVEDDSGLCPVCSLPVYEPSTPTGGCVVERHQPWVSSVGKVGIHSPSCREVDDECICGRAA